MLTRARSERSSSPSSSGLAGLSEGGFELIYQGTVAMPHWTLRLGARHAWHGVITHRIEVIGEGLKGNERRLQSLSPLAILERGYAIATLKGKTRPLRRSSETQPGDELALRLHEGRLLVKTL